MTEEKFETVTDALESLKQGTTSETQVRKQFGDVDGIERSVAVALSKQVNTKSREEVSDVVTSGLSNQRL